jgi:hypothetical protein
MNNFVKVLNQDKKNNYLEKFYNRNSLDLSLLKKIAQPVIILNSSPTKKSLESNEPIYEPEKSDEIILKNIDRESPIKSIANEPRNEIITPVANIKDDISNYVKGPKLTTIDISQEEEYNILEPTSKRASPITIEPETIRDIQYTLGEILFMWMSSLFILFHVRLDFLEFL